MSIKSFNHEHVVALYKKERIQEKQPYEKIAALDKKINSATTTMFAALGILFTATIIGVTSYFLLQGHTLALNSTCSVALATASISFLALPIIYITRDNKITDKNNAQKTLEMNDSRAIKQMVISDIQFIRDENAFIKMITPILSNYFNEEDVDHLKQSLTFTRAQSTVDEQVKLEQWIKTASRQEFIYFYNKKDQHTSPTQ